MNDSDENELRVQLQSGDAQSLGTYLERHRSEIQAFLHRITGDHLLAVVPVEDLYQDLAASAWAAFPKVAGPHFEPMPWLLQLARRRVADAYRFHFGAQRRSQSKLSSLDSRNRGDEGIGLEELLVSSITSPSAAVSRNMRLRRVDDALQELGDEAALIVRMRYVDGFTTQEIADRLHKTDVAIRVALSRCLKKLTDILGDE